ncbi:acyltransferase family protein [Pedobacter caeni]|uniref:Peptidoglycan/LPS O-acetylase OafA/YrhL, contains acyltransferase and SGNH-hydrolase domains n=1 Tax=Pedobacter caeni TaxID=288992 RepID=A0A1M4UAS8_9SPHI|nr:acyltransferase family protein [Pedobacter caeni]SHE53981.1 Peptidoglycan/LPS O-acetylase OafA/YrhL, contains acyltransferase and SGNH-hydrolase domains [Pedobacter caeni]
MENTARQTYLDWLRILSIAGVLFFHSAMPYVAEDGWHIKNAETSNLLMESNMFLHLFRMPLLFFISGTVSFYMMQRRSTLNFIGLRFRRLLIPLVFSILIIVPPQVYMERLVSGYQGSFWEWYPRIFDFVPYPKGNFSWHHLWFIAYLFIYDLMFAPLFAWLISSKSNGFKTKLEMLAKDKRVYLLMLPGIIWYTLMSPAFPETNDLINDPAYFVYWLLFLMAGFICILEPKLMDSLERNRRFALTIGFLALMLLNYLRWNKIEPGYENWYFRDESFASLFYALKPIVAWAWVFALTGYGKHYLNRKYKLLSYLNEAAYPFYILHQTVIVILVYYIVQLPDESILSKYIYTLALTFFISVLTYHLLIRPFAVSRFLFGMKPIKKTEGTEKLKEETT